MCGSFLLRMAVFHKGGRGVCWFGRESTCQLCRGFTFPSVEHVLWLHEALDSIPGITSLKSSKVAGSGKLISKRFLWLNSNHHEKLAFSNSGQLCLCQSVHVLPFSHFIITLMQPPVCNVWFFFPLQAFLFHLLLAFSILFPSTLYYLCPSLYQLFLGSLFTFFCPCQ